MSSEKTSIITTVKNLTEREVNRLLWTGAIILFMYLYFNEQGKNQDSCKSENTSLQKDKETLLKENAKLTATIIDVVTKVNADYRKANIQKDSTIMVLRKANVKLSE